MTQVLQTKDGSLPQALTIQNTYTKLRKGSKNTVIVVRNSMGPPPNSQKEKPGGTRVVATTVGARAAGRDQSDWRGRPALKHSHTYMTVRQRPRMLFEELDLSGLESWPLELAESAHQLLAEYHNVFSLEPAELGCTHLPNTQSR